MPCCMEEITMKDLEPTILTGPLLSQWYRKRAVNIEHQSKLVINARLFVELAIERNIKVLGYRIFTHIHTYRYIVDCVRISVDSSFSLCYWNLHLFAGIGRFACWLRHSWMYGLRIGAWDRWLHPHEHDWPAKMHKTTGTCESRSYFFKPIVIENSRVYNISHIPNN